MMKKLIAKRRLFKFINFFALGVLVINMSFMGVLFVSPSITEADVAPLCNPYGACIYDTGYPGCYVNDSCATDLFCGDGITTASMEECDDGAGTNGIACDPAYGSSCTYCSDTCTEITLDGGTCGDQTIDEGNEECDDGEDNGEVCDPAYDGNCTYCTNECTEITLNGGECGDGTIDQGYEDCEIDADCETGEICNACACEAEPTADLTIIKDAGGNNDWNFAFNGAGITTFYLADSESEVLSGLPVGDITIIETVDTNGEHSWVLDNVICDGAEVVVDGNSATITLEPGDDATCTFYNVWDYGCSDGATDACDTGLDGICDAGTKLCDGGVWGTCNAIVNPGEVDEVCDNGLDDDCDGLTDCEDSDCDGTPECTTPTASLTICKYNDLDQNQTKDTSDTPLAWPFAVGLTSGGPAIDITTSGETGCYTIDDLTVGDTYTVTEADDNDDTDDITWVKSSPESGSQEITLAAGGNNVTFLNYEESDDEETGSIKICKYNDINRNGDFDIEVDEAIDTWTFTVNDEETDMTGEDGCVVLDDMPYDSYDISEVMQLGWEQTGVFVDGVPVDGSSATIELDSETVTVMFLNKTLICGHKYDYDNPLSTGGYAPIADWEITLTQVSCPCTGECEAIASIPSLSQLLPFTDNILTNENGAYCFDLDDYYNDTAEASIRIADRCYMVSEETRDNWTPHYIETNITPFDEDETSVSFFYNRSQAVFVDFYNYEESSCGDGTCNGDENCETCSQDCGSCGGGSDPYCGDGAKNNGEECDGNDGVPSGYSCTSGCKLQQNGGGTTLFPTNRFGSSPTPAPAPTPTPEPTVLGEEGEPTLGIDKIVNKDFVNPGDKGVEYTVKVTNSGNITAFDVVLKDKLPEGMTYSDNGETERTWNLGDIAPGETKEVKYTVDIADNVDVSKLTNTAEVSASNHDTVSDSVDVELKKVEVLAATGFEMRELFMLMGMLCTAIAGMFLLQKRLS